MALTLYVGDKNNKTDDNTFTMTMCTAGGIVGATVSALVYNTITATGDITASITQSGIDITGDLLASGTEYIGGTIAANTVRAISKTSSMLAGPAIQSTSRSAATGLSILLGGISAITTSAVIYGGKKIGEYIKYKSDEYKENIIKRVQYPMITEEDIELIEFDNEGDNQLMLVN